MIRSDKSYFSQLSMSLAPPCVVRRRFSARSPSTKRGVCPALRSSSDRVRLEHVERASADPRDFDPSPRRRSSRVPETRADRHARPRTPARRRTLACLRVNNPYYLFLSFRDDDLLRRRRRRRRVRIVPRNDHVRRRYVPVGGAEFFLFFIVRRGTGTGTGPATSTDVM